MKNWGAVVNHTKDSLALVVLMLIAGIGFAQNLIFSPVEGREQLNEEKIRNIIQLKDGRMGVFTEGMLNLYDGAGFKTIPIDDQNTIALPNYTGFHHTYLESNRLWFKNLGKLAVVDLAQEVALTDSKSLLQGMGFQKALVDLYIDASENIWGLTSDFSLVRKMQGHSGVTVFLKDVRRKDDLQDVLFDVVSSAKKTYLIYRSGFIREFDTVSGKELYHTQLVAKEDHFNNWVHATWVQDQLYIVRGGYNTGQLVRFHTRNHQVDVLIEAKEYWLNCFAANKQGDFYMSCREGLWYFKAGERSGRLMEQMPLKDGEYLRTEISTIYVDNQDGFWAGTLNKGLFYYHPNRFRFELFEKASFEDTEVGEMQINSFAETNDVILLIGTNKGLYKVTLNSGLAFKPVVVMSGLECTSMFKDEQGTVWIGTSEGLYHWNEGTQMVKVFPESVNCLYTEDAHAFYVGTVANGIYKVILPVKALQTSMERIRLTEAVPNVKQIIKYNDQLMGLCQSGVFVLDKDTFQPEFPLESEKHVFPMFDYVNHKYTCLLKDTDEDLWLGTYDGLTLWSSRENKLYSIHTDQGLVNNSIKAIIEDQDHSFWVTTSMGMSRIYKKKTPTGYVFDIQNFNKYNGLIDHAFAERSVFLSSQGVLYTGGIDGMNVLSPKNKNNHLELQPIVLGLKIFGKSKDFDVNELGLTYQNEVALRHHQNFFTIAFSGLNYVNPLQTFYRFKLEGIDEQWREKKTMLGNGEANYTGLPPGTYTFKVQASSDGLNWSGSTDTLRIEIAPPFWKTSWAYTLYLILLTMGITVLVGYLNRRMASKRQQAQDQAVELAKSEFITNISHELRTPLTLVITPLRALILKINDQLLKKELLQINNNAQLLLDVVNQLLEFKKMDLGKETLQPQFYENLLCIEELARPYVDVAQQKGVTLYMEVSQEPLAIFIDRQKVCRIVANLLSNALKYTPTGGQITLKAWVDDFQKSLMLEVRDTGIGMDEQEQLKVFDRFYRAKNQDGGVSGSGLGLYMVKEYALLHHGEVQVSSTPYKGTTFTVTLSVAQETQTADQHVKADTSKATILLADDNAGFRNYLKSELEWHYQVIVCCNGQEALEQTLLHSPDLVISDMMMPELTGDEFCKSLRNEVSISHTPVILLTGRTSNEARLQGYESGADAYLVKPFDIQVLMTRIEKLLELTHARRKSFVEATTLQTDTVTTNSLDKTILDKALGHVQDNLKNPDYSVEKFSADMCMDRTGLYRKLMALTGLSPTAFIRNIRLKRAVALLLKTQMPITVVAEETGFNSVSYFTKCFHEVYGKTPSQYRAEHVS